MADLLKLVGAVLVLFAGTLIGFYKAAQFARRPKQIRQLILALQRLETEILYGYTPLPEALTAISKQLAEPLASMFKLTVEQLDRQTSNSTKESWQSAVSEMWSRTSMGEGEKEILSQLGFTLGVTDREDQIKHLRLAVSQLQGEEQTAWEDQKRYEKMWKSLGVLSGALIVILMY